MTSLTWVVYLWYDGDTPYFAGKCRKGSQAMFTDKGEVFAPENRDEVKVVYESNVEQSALNKLDELEFEYGLEAAQAGTLRNRLDRSANFYREKPCSHSRPVDAYRVNGDFVGSYDSVGAASLCLGINRGNIHSCMTGNLQTTVGFVFVDKGEPFKLDPAWRNASTLMEPVVGYDPEGQKLHFMNIREAAHHVVGEGSISGVSRAIKSSLSSPTEYKSTVRGYVFFLPEDVPPYDDVVKKKPRGKAANY